MSKERLEEIKKDIESHKSWARGTHYAEVTYEELEEIDWLIEQAEQLKNLKESIHIITTVRKSIYDSHEQVYLIKKAVNDL